MASSYFETRGRNLDAPITSSDQEAYAVEEPNLTDATNKEIDRLQTDKNAQFDLWISQSNHLHTVQSKIPDQILALTGQAVKTRKALKEYNEFIEPIQEFHRKMDEASEYHKQATFATGAPPKTLEQIAVDVDSEVAKEAKFNGEKLDVDAELNTAEFQLRREGRIDEATAISQGPEDRDFVPVRTKEREFYKSKFTILEDWEAFSGRADAGMTMPIPGKVMPNGQPLLKTFDQTQFVHEARYIANAQMYRFLYENRHLTMGRNGRFKQKFVIPMIKKLDAKMKAKIEDLADAGNKVAQQLRAEDLEVKLQDNPSYFVDYVNLYRGVHNGSYKLARMEAAKTVASMAESGGIRRDTVERVLDEPFLGNDGNMHTIRDYWKEETGIMLAGVRKAENTAATEAQNQEDSRIERAADEQIVQWRGQKTPPTIEERRKALMKLAGDLNINIDHPKLEPIRKHFTDSDLPDAEIDWNLTKRLKRGESLQLSDLDGIEDPELWAAWKQKLTPEGVDTKSRDSFIIGKVNAKTLETDGNKDKTDSWRAYKDNATNAFNDAYVLAKANGATHAEAMKAGQDAVTNGLDIGGNDTSWSQWGGNPQSVDSILNLGKAKAAVSKDKSIIDSDQPWVGEEPHIKEALEYLNDRRVNIPTYYRNFPNIKRLSNGKVATPYNLMIHRLDSMGLLKGNKPIPEDDLPVYLQELLRKPSPSKTNRVINEEEGGSALGKYYNLSDTSTSLRQGNQVALQYNSLNNDYTQLAEFEPELSDEFVATVGVTHWSNRPENLQRDVLRAYIADTLMTA